MHPSHPSPVFHLLELSAYLLDTGVSILKVSGRMMASQFIPNVVHHGRIINRSNDVGGSRTILSIEYCHHPALATSQYSFSRDVDSR